MTALMQLLSASSSAWLRWTRMSQSAVCCRPRRSDEHAVALRCISESCQPLSSCSVLPYRTEILLFILLSRPLSAGAAEKDGFQILIKRQDSVLVCVCVSSGSVWKEGSGLGLCLQLLHSFLPFKRSLKCVCVRSVLGGAFAAALPLKAGPLKFMPRSRRQRFFCVFSRAPDR